MKDLQLWQMLYSAPDDPSGEVGLLCALLRELAARDVAERWPFFGRLEPWLQSPCADVRAAAAAAIAGATGNRGVKAVVRLLSDDDAAVRFAAVRALAASATHDPAHWAHAAFSRHADVRLAALDHPPGRELPWYALLLLPDDACRAKVLAAEPGKVAASAIHAVIEFAGRGLLPVEAARDLVAGMAVEQLFDALLQAGPGRTEDTVEAMLAAAARNKRLTPEILRSPPSPDAFDPLVDLLWQAGPGTRQLSSARGPRERFFEKLTSWCLDRRHRDDANRLLCSILVKAVATGEWDPLWAETACLIDPDWLGFDWIGRATRADSVRALYRYGSRLAKRSEDQVAKLIATQPCRFCNGRLDLWVIGGVLRFAASGAYQLLVRVYSMDAIVDAFVADPPASTHLFSVSGDADGRSKVLAAITARSHDSTGAILSGLIAISPADELHFLDDLAPAEWLSLYKALVDGATAERVRLSDNKLRRLAEGISRKVSPNLLDAFARATADAASPDEPPPLLLRGLSSVAREAGGELMLSTLKKLTPSRLLRVLHIIPHCAGFPFGVELQLAHGLQKHSNDAVRDWCRARIAEKVQVPSGALPNVTVRQLDPAIADRIATCATAALGGEVESCFAAPTRGLCDALARRRPPGMRSIQTCVALLGCHDPTETVVEQFAIYSGPDADFLTKLDAAVVKQWSWNKHLPMLGNCWLHLWDPHCFAAGEVLMAWQGGLTGALTWANTLPVTLKLQVYGAIARLLAMWRRREPAKLAALDFAALCPFLVAALPSDAGVPAAKTLVSVYESAAAAQLMSDLRPRVIALLPELPDAPRAILQPWVDGRGLGSAAGRPVEVPPDPEILRRIAVSTDTLELAALCRRLSAEEVRDAVFRLVELGDGGVEQIVELLTGDDPPALARILAETLPIWPAGPALMRIKRFYLAADGSSETLFVIGAGLVDCGEIGIEALLDLCRRPVEVSWFRSEHWRRLAAMIADPIELAAAMATSPHASAYQPAVASLCDGLKVAASRPVAMDALRAFLLCGTGRLHSLRLSVAAALRGEGYLTGLPLLLQDLLTVKHGGSQRVDQPAFLVGLPASAIADAAGAVLVAGSRIADEWAFAHLLDSRGVDVAARDEARLALLKDAAGDSTRAHVIERLRPTESRAVKLRRLAQTFAWGIVTGRELTGRVFAVEMNAGEGLGYTRFDSDKVWISPMPILRGEQHAEAITRGLIVHEFGHHMYHRGPEPQKVWKQASDAGYHGLLNLVSDEHLERNLRTVSDEHGDNLKKLGAYAFQHSVKQLKLESLLTALQSRAFDVLTRTPLDVSREHGCVQVNSGRLLADMDRAAMSFPRFVRALRMGLGNRTGDLKVAQGLALFKGAAFRSQSMEGLNQISLRLREIFGWETRLIEGFGQDSILVPSSSELLADGEGITAEEVRDAVRRLLDERKHGRRSKNPPVVKTINRGEDESFTTITTIVPVSFDPVKHMAYAGQVAASAREMRRYLLQLGLQMVPQRFRIQGNRVDRARLVSAGLLRGDPRLLIARKPHIEPDLFIGLIIDCSSSMSMSNHIEQAKLFGTLLAEAARDVPGIDTRVWGFNDAVIYDAGDAGRCSAHNLEAGGGNNDAAALWHAASIARASRRRAKLLVMISDGSPTECTTAALQTLVSKLTHRMGICCAQVAVCPLTVRCFPHYIELEEANLSTSVRRFGGIITRLVQKAVRGG